MPTPSTQRRSLTDRLILGPGAALITSTLRLLARSLKFELQRDEHYKSAVASGRPLIFVFWHEHLASVAIMRERLGHGEVAIMISRSRDGEKLAAVICRLGMKTVRASSSRGAVAGLLQLSRYLRAPREGAAPRTAAIAPDGPRGPRHEAKPGVALLARKADALIIPVGFAYSRALSFGSWDRTRLPLPFSRLTARLAPPIDPRQWPGNDVTHAIQLGKLLDKLDRQAAG